MIMFYLQGCGYVPMYSKNQRVDFYIQSINFDDGDKDLANFIKINLNNYFEKNIGNEFIIDTKITYQKTSVTKTAEAVTEEYNLTSNVSFLIKSGDIEKTVKISETSKMDNFSDEFEEREYEKVIKKNMARSIVSKLLIQLMRFDVN